MEIKKIWAIYFSPVGNTERIVVSLAESVRKKLNLTLGLVCKIKVA